MDNTHPFAKMQTEQEIPNQNYYIAPDQAETDLPPDLDNELIKAFSAFEGESCSLGAILDPAMNGYAVDVEKAIVFYNRTKSALNKLALQIARVAGEDREVDPEEL